MSTTEPQGTNDPTVRPSRAANVPSQQQLDSQRGERKVRQGVVVSDKMDKTVVVRVERRTTHPLYRKTVTRSEKFHAHDETNDVHVGDRVRIVETRPLSKTKHWRILEVLERAR